MSTSQGSVTVHEAPPLIRWRSWPLREHPVAGSFLSAAVAGTALGVAQLTGRAYLGALALAALVISLWRFFVPTVFELNADGVHQWTLGQHRQIAWKSVRRYEIFTDGVLLLPLAERCAIDALRGLYLPWKGHRDEVLANVRHYLAAIAEDPVGL